MKLFNVPETLIPIAGGGQQFPVRRIYCIGRNYAAHAREMGHNPEREPPFFFTKPADSIVLNGSVIDYPKRTKNLHHEIELVVAIGRTGSEIAVTEAAEYVFGYAVGIDLTRRDLQAAAKKKGRPWATAKGFDQSAPISAVHSTEAVGHPEKGSIWLKVNDEIRQKGDLNELIWSVPEAIAELSTLFTIAPGDLIFTGTPAGVGPLDAGDQITGGIESIDEISITIK